MKKIRKVIKLPEPESEESDSSDIPDDIESDIPDASSEDEELSCSASSLNVMRAPSIRSSVMSDFNSEDYKW